MSRLRRTLAWIVLCSAVCGSFGLVSYSITLAVLK